MPQPGCRKASRQVRRGRADDAVRRLCAATAVTIVGLGVLAFPGMAGAATDAASAATGGPPPTVSTQSAMVEAGTSIRGMVCGFAPGSVVTFVINRAANSTARAGRDGCATDAVSSSARRLVVNGGPPVRAALGANSLVAAGTGPAGQPNTDVVTLTLSPAAGSQSGQANGLTYRGVEIMAAGIGILALAALAFLILTFTRRRLTAP